MDVGFVGLVGVGVVVRFCHVLLGRLVFVGEGLPGSLTCFRLCAAWRI